MLIKIITVGASIGLLLSVLELIRKEKLTFKYAFAWIIVTILTIFFAFFDTWLFKIAYLLGFELPSNFIFFGFSGIFVVLSFLMTIFLCQQNSRNDTMAQKIGILEFELKQLKKQIEHKDNDDAKT